MQEKWLKWATEIQSIAQAGLTYSKDKYDIERFEQLRDLSAEIIGEYAEIEVEKVKDLLSKEIGYLTPKVDIRAAIIENDKVLLVKESIDGCWSMPGGWADVNLTISENILKECKEEAGAKVIPKKIVSILDKNKYNSPKSFESVYKIFVLCDLVEIKFKKNIETDESRFFSLDELPKLSLARNTRKQIEFCFDSYKNKNLDTIFD